LQALALVLARFPHPHEQSNHVVPWRPARGVLPVGGVHAVAGAVPGDSDPAHGDVAAGRVLVLHLRGLHRGGHGAAQLAAAGRAHRARPPHQVDLLRRVLRGILRVLPFRAPVEGQPLRRRAGRRELAVGRRHGRRRPPRARQLPLHLPGHVEALTARWIVRSLPEP
jgi:hypothetical protein